MAIIFSTIIVVIASFLVSGNLAARNVAILIGVSDYRDAPLRTPTRDVDEIAEALRQIGWSTNVIKNPTKREVIASLKDFRAVSLQLSSNDIALVYFSGHGFQLGNQNYLMLGGEHSTFNSARASSLTSLDIIETLASSDAAKVILLDACRTPPFDPRNNIMLSQGLLQITAPSNTVLGFATAPHATALDGNEDISPYAKGIVFGLQNSRSLDDFFRSVRRSTIYATGGEQVPWEASSLLKDYALYSSSTSSVSPTDGSSGMSQLTVITQKREEIAQSETATLDQQQNQLVEYILEHIRNVSLRDIYIWDDRLADERDRRDFLDTVIWDHQNQTAAQFWGNLGESLVSGVLHPSCRAGGTLKHDCGDYDRAIYLPMNAKIAYKINTLSYKLGGRTDGLARMYEDGIYVKKDYLKAYDLYLEAKDRDGGKGTWSDYAWTDVNRLAQRLLTALSADIQVDGDFGANSCAALQSFIGKANCGRMISRGDFERLLRAAELI
ncbi:caspase family protein [Nitrosomonas cryotolerans]|uniref:caspase family protein n=1 Tax=Nitrosomonas cryotolerans TaxID=44575 RepID=UPI0015A6211E|nr:caspase family protein [Nitrosomonas cryotolerans]